VDAKAPVPWDFGAPSGFAPLRPQAELRSGEKPISLTTLRSYSNAVGMFCAYLTHPGYGWGEFCERTFGDIPSQICFEWNTPKHAADDAVPAKRQAFTKAELQRIFDHMPLHIGIVGLQAEDGGVCGYCYQQAKHTRGSCA
jgi:hypothetical protein